jgi:hypothetical protein
MPTGTLPASLRDSGADIAHSSRGSVLDPAWCGWSLRPLQRQGLRGHRGRPPASPTKRPLSRSPRCRAGRRALHDRDLAVARRRRGKSRRGCHRRCREPLRRLVAPVPLRGPVLAWRPDPRPRLRGGRAPPAHQRSSGRPPATRPRHDRAQACVGARRAEDGRDVELELRDRMADRQRRPTDRPPAAATARSRTGFGRRSRSGSAYRAQERDTPRLGKPPLAAGV